MTAPELMPVMFPTLPQFVGLLVDGVDDPLARAIDSPSLGITILFVNTSFDKCRNVFARFRDASAKFSVVRVASNTELPAVASFNCVNGVDASLAQTLSELCDRRKSHCWLVDAVASPCDFVLTIGLLSVRRNSVDDGTRAILLLRGVDVCGCIWAHSALQVSRLLSPSKLLHKHEVRFALIGSVHTMFSCVNGASPSAVLIAGMFFIGIVLIGFDTRFDNDFIGDCSSSEFASLPVTLALRFACIDDNELTIFLRLSKSSFDNIRSFCWVAVSLECRWSFGFLAQFSSSDGLALVDGICDVDAVRDHVLRGRMDDVRWSEWRDIGVRDDSPEVEASDEVDALDEFTVLSCNWISIMWSPRRMLRFNGVFPLRKSLTWESFSDSSACITVFSGRWA